MTKINENIFPIEKVKCKIFALPTLQSSYKKNEGGNVGVQTPMALTNRRLLLRRLENRRYRQIFFDLNIG